MPPVGIRGSKRRGTDTSSSCGKLWLLAGAFIGICALVRAGAFSDYGHDNEDSGLSERALEVGGGAVANMLDSVVVPKETVPVAIGTSRRAGAKGYGGFDAEVSRWHITSGSLILYCVSTLPVVWATCLNRREVRGSLRFFACSLFVGCVNHPVAREKYVTDLTVLYNRQHRTRYR